MNLPPLHPILVNFTAALVPVSLVSDVLGRVLRKQSFTATGWWTLFYAALVTPLTAIAGWYWLRQMGDMDHAEMTIHKWLGTSLAVVFFGLLFWRWRIQRAGLTPGWVYLACAAAVVTALILQGHLGGRMSFAPDDTSSADQGEHHDHTAPNNTPATAPTDANQWKDHIDVKG